MTLRKKTAMNVACHGSKLMNWKVRFCMDLELMLIDSSVSF